ncbi:MAG: hypothetical protein ACOC6E_01950 [Thermodesulfobacteriota bacterium]
MGKTKKGPAIDPALKERLDQTLADLAAAQEQGVPPHEIFKKLSIDLQEEAPLAVALIDALTTLPSIDTAQLLVKMREETHDKKVIKAIKRSLYRLKQKGVTWEEKPSEEKPAFAPPKPAEPEGYLSPIDAAGSRIIAAARTIPQRGLWVIFSIASDVEGIQQLTVNQFTRKEFRSFLRDSLSSEEFPVIEAPGAYCIHLLKEAKALTQSLSRPLPQGFDEAISRFRDVVWDEPGAIIYRYIKEDEIKDIPYLLQESARLHAVMPFASWYLEEQEVGKYAAQIAEAEQSKIVLRPDQKEARINAVYRQAMEELFPEEKRLLWKRRLEEMAYVLLKTGNEDEARQALSAAVDLKKPLSAIEPNLFIWNLVLKSIEILLERDQEKKEEKQKSSLIVPP